MPLLRSRGRKSLATGGFAGAYLARQGIYTLSPETALLLRNKSTAKGVIYYGSFPGGTKQGLYRNEQPPPTQQGAIPKSKGAVVANAPHPPQKNFPHPLPSPRQLSPVSAPSLREDKPPRSHVRKQVDTWAGYQASAAGLSKGLSQRTLTKSTKRGTNSSHPLTILPRCGTLVL